MKIFCNTQKEKKESDECGIKSIPSYSGLSGASHWECTGGVVNTCALKCDHDGFIPMKVECNINGQLKWSTPSKSQLKLGNCDRCSEDLSVNYPITGRYIIFINKVFVDYIISRIFVTVQLIVDRRW